MSLLKLKSDILSLMGFPHDSAVSFISDILSLMAPVTSVLDASVAGTITAPTLRWYRFDVRCLCGPLARQTGLSKAHHAERADFVISPALSRRLMARMIVRSLRPVRVASFLMPGHALFSWSAQSAMSMSTSCGTAPAALHCLAHAIASLLIAALLSQRPRRDTGAYGVFYDGLGAVPPAPRPAQGRLRRPECD